MFMKITENVLSEFEEKTFERGKYYHLAIALSCIYILLAASDLIFDFESFSWKQFYFDWFSLIMLVIIPGTGIILTIKKSKIGWFISTLYFSFFSVLAILSIGREFLEFDNTSEEFVLTARKLIIIAITILPSIFFQTKSLRVSFQINALVWISAIITALCLAVALFIFS